MSYTHKIQKDKGAEPDEFEASVAQVRLEAAAAGRSPAQMGLRRRICQGKRRTRAGARVLGRGTWHRRSTGGTGFVGEGARGLWEDPHPKPWGCRCGGEA
jgi:hypothetical protein